MAQILPILVPVGALILALIVVAVLWYWWTSGQPEPPEGEGGEGQPEQAKSAPGGFEKTLSGVLSTARSAVSGLMNSAGASIEVRRVGGTSSSTEIIEVLRLHRDLSTGALVVQIGRQKYYSLDEIADPQVRRRFLGNAEAMAQFAQFKKGTSPLIDWSAAAPPPASPSQPPLPVPPLDSPVSQPPLVTPPPPPFARPPQASTGTADSGSGKKGKEEVKPKSMADEIEELLQYRLALDPEFSRRSIHIRSAEDGSIFVEVDGANFDGIGDVSDDEVRGFLQKIVQEWEARK